MGRKPLSAYTPEELAQKEIEKNREKVDTMFEYGSENIEEIREFVTNMNQDTFLHLISKITARSSALDKRIEELENKVRELQEVNENMSNAFGRRNEYGF